MKKYTDKAFDSLDEGQNYYQHVKLSEIVNDFMLAEVGEGMLIPAVKQQLVEFHAQRAIQELSYDTLKSVKSREYLMEGDIYFNLPQDLIKPIGLFWLDETGVKHYMNERVISGNPESPLYDDNQNYLYDQEGNRLDSATSDSVLDWNKRTETDSYDFNNYFVGSFQTEGIYERYFTAYYGRRYGADPSELNINGTYVYDKEEHAIYVDTNFTDRTIVLDYLTDGLGDFDTIRIHKLAEEAVYGYIRYKLIYGKRDMPLYEKQLAKKEYSIAKRRTKHRLSQLGEALNKALKGQAKWIKH